MAEEDLPNPSGVLVYFLVISIIYLVYTAIQLFSSEKNTTTLEAINSVSNNMTVNIVYILVLIVGTYFINTNISKAMCESRKIDWLNILFITLLPWLLIFVLLYFLLETFPGWVTPFSNTIGYLVVTLLGVESKLKELLETSTATGKEAPDLVKAIANIKSNKSKFINQFDEDPDKFKEFINELKKGGILSNEIKAIESIGSAIDKPILEIYKLVTLKHIIGKLFWYILAGILISSISYSFIINLTCNKTVEEARREYEELMDI